MKKLLLGLVLCVPVLGMAKGVCDKDVCEKFYKAAVVSHFGISMKSTIIGEQSYQVRMIEKDESKGIAVYVDGMETAVKEAKDEVLPLYQASLKSAQGNKDVSAAIKELYTKWLAGVSYFQRAVTETPRAKDEQVKIDRKAIEDAWAKVQVEAGI